MKVQTYIHKRIHCCSCVKQMGIEIEIAQCCVKLFVASSVTGFEAMQQGFATQSFPLQAKKLVFR